MQDSFGLQSHAHPDRELESSWQGETYYRYPICTKLVAIGEDYLEVMKEFATPAWSEVKEPLFLAVSEKLIAICQKQVIHESKVKAGWLAKLIVRFVKKYPNDTGFENPKKMQVAINQAGYFRMFFAVTLGGIAKFLFKKPGWFYRIAGNHINAIDGFDPDTIEPFDQYAILAPKDPGKVCQEIEEKFGIPTIIIDANNIATNILGTSKNIQEKLGFDEQALKVIVDGNPMGQGSEQTPMFIVTKQAL